MRYLGGGVHSGHILSSHYSSKSEDKRIYTFRKPIWWPSWISHFTQAIYYILYSRSNLFWISSYMYLGLISTHELLLSAAIIF